MQEILGLNPMAEAGLILIYSESVPKPQNCPQLTPESVIKHIKIVRN